MDNSSLFQQNQQNVKGENREFININQFSENIKDDQNIGDIENIKNENEENIKIDENIKENIKIDKNVGDIKNIKNDEDVKSDEYSENDEDSNHIINTKTDQLNDENKKSVPGIKANEKVESKNGRLPISNKKEEFDNCLNGVANRVETFEKYNSKKNEIKKQYFQNKRNYRPEFLGVVSLFTSFLADATHSNSEEVEHKLSKLMLLKDTIEEYTADFGGMELPKIQSYDAFGVCVDSFDPDAYSQMDSNKGKDFFKNFLYPQYRSLIPELEQLIDDECYDKGCTPREAEIIKLLTTKKLKRQLNGHTINELYYQTPLANLISVFEACLNISVKDKKLKNLMTQYGSDFPIYEYIKEGSKLLDLFIEYGEEKEKGGDYGLPKDTEEKYRSLLYSQILEVIRIYDRMIEVTANQEMVNEINGVQMLGNDIFHINPFAERGASVERASLETYKICLENGWAIDDIASVAAFRNIIVNMEKNAFSKAATSSYDKFEAKEQASYWDPEVSKYVEELKSCYKKIAETPLKDNQSRQAFLDEMDTLIEKGIRERLLVNNNEGSCTEDKTAIYYAYVSNRRKVRDYEVGNSKQKESEVFSKLKVIDKRVNKLNEYAERFNTNEGENSIFRTSESSEHRKMRGDMEKLQRFMMKKKKSLANFLDPDYQLTEADLDILSSYYAKLDRLAVSTQKYIAAKNKWFNGDSKKGKNRLSGALNIKEMVKTEKYRVYKLLEKNKAFRHCSYINAQENNHYNLIHDKFEIKSNKESEKSLEYSINNISDDSSRILISDDSELNVTLQFLNGNNNSLLAPDKNEKMINPVSDNKVSIRKIKKKNGNYNTNINYDLEKAKEKEIKLVERKKKEHYYEEGVNDAKMFFIRKNYYEGREQLISKRKLQDHVPEKESIITCAANYVLGRQARIYDTLRNGNINCNDDIENQIREYYNMDYETFMNKAKDMKDCVMSNGIEYSVEAIKNNKVFKNIIKEAFDNNWSGTKLRDKLNLKFPEIKIEKMAKNEEEKVTEVRLLHIQNNKVVNKPILR